MYFYILFYLCTLKQNKYERKEKNNPIVPESHHYFSITGTLAYKHQLFDGKLPENIPKSKAMKKSQKYWTSPQHDGALEIPMIQSSTGGQILKRKGYTLSYNADYKTPQWVAWNLLKRNKRKEGRTNKFLPDRTYVEPKHIRVIIQNQDTTGDTWPCRRYEMEQTSHGRIFYMSNICPQNPNLNRGDWNDLEEKSRQWAKNMEPCILPADLYMILNAPNELATIK